eukprot:275890-Amorphochlora_amoeboformis.AAC.3
MHTRVGRVTTMADTACHTVYYYDGPLIVLSGVTLYLLASQAAAASLDVPVFIPCNRCAVACLAAFCPRSVCWAAGGVLAILLDSDIAIWSNLGVGLPRCLEEEELSCRRTCSSGHPPRPVPALHNRGMAHPPILSGA